MTTSFSPDVEYLVFTANEIQYGVSHESVVSVIDLPAATAVPGLPAEVRGVIPFRDRSIPLIDLRRCFGATGRLTETNDLVATMAQRKQDHLNWLNKLEDEVYSGKPISVQTDPHLCVFGKWYDQFRSDNRNLTDYMKRFDVPHKEIHRVAVDVQEMISRGRTEEAKRLVRLTEHGVLARLVELFDGLGEIVRKYLLEYAIIFQLEGQTLAMTADDINFFSRLDHVQYPLPAGLETGTKGVVQAIGRYQEENGAAYVNILLLDLMRLVHQFDGLEAAHG